MSSTRPFPVAPTAALLVLCACTFGADDGSDFSGNGDATSTSSTADDGAGDDGDDGGGTATGTSDGGSGDGNGTGTTTGSGDGGSDDGGTGGDCNGTPLDPQLEVPPTCSPTCTNIGFNGGDCDSLEICRLKDSQTAVCETCEPCGNLHASCTASSQCDILFTCFKGQCTAMCDFTTPQTCGNPAACVDVGHPTHGVCDPTL